MKLNYTGYRLYEEMKKATEPNLFNIAVEDLGEGFDRLQQVPT